MFDRIDSDLMDEVRAFRASRQKVHCTCGIGPDPGCRIDHQGAAEDRAIAEQHKTASAAWYAEAAGEIDELFRPALWSLLIAGDDIALGRRLRELFAAKAKREVGHEMGEDCAL